MPFYYGVSLSALYFCFEKFKNMGRAYFLTEYDLCYNICITKERETRIYHMMIMVIQHLVVHLMLRILIPLFLFGILMSR